MKPIYHTITEKIHTNTIVWVVLINGNRAEITLDAVPGQRLNCTEYMIRNNNAYFVTSDQSLRLKSGKNLNCFGPKDLKALKMSLKKVLDWLKSIGVEKAVFMPVDFQRYIATIYLVRKKYKFLNDGYNPRTYIRSKEFVGFITIKL